MATKDQEKPLSRRQELLRFAASGELRQALERNDGAKLSPEAIDLAVDVVIRYCESR